MGICYISFLDIERIKAIIIIIIVDHLMRRLSDFGIFDHLLSPSKGPGIGRCYYLIIKVSLLMIEYWYDFNNGCEVIYWYKVVNMQSTGLLSC